MERTHVNIIEDVIIILKKLSKVEIFFNDGDSYIDHYKCADCGAWVYKFKDEIEHKSDCKLQSLMNELEAYIAVEKTLKEICKS